MCKLYLIPCLFFGVTACHLDHSHPTHAEDDVEAIQITLWNEETELFIEYPPIIVGEPTQFVTHVTYLDSWRPKTDGSINFILTMAGEAPIKVVAPTPAREGIYLPELTFPKVGEWDIEVEVPLAKTTSVQKISGATVYQLQTDVPREPSQSDEDISFLKEQQWKMPFSVAVVTRQPMRQSLMANGMIMPRAGGEVVIHAPVSGRLASSESAIVHIGNIVREGQVLGSLIPRLNQADDRATLALAVEKAELALDHARLELKRVEGLLKVEAIPAARLNVAKLEAENAQADLTAAQERQHQFDAIQRESDSVAKGRLDLICPLSGTVVEASLVPGALITAGEKLFHIIDLSKIWLEIRIPEGNIGRVIDAQGAWFEVEGLQGSFEVDPSSGGRLIALGGKIDERRRTVPLIFELSNPNGLLKIGMFARVSVLTGDVVSSPAIPLNALVEEGGQSVAYVQTAGESFARRILEVGIRDRDHVQILSGLETGERVVTQGAYQIRLAAGSTTVPAHGHAH